MRAKKIPWSIVVWITGLLLLVLLMVKFSPNQFYHHEHFSFYFDHVDLKVYFEESRWVKGPGTLYKDVFSEYLLLPNLFFAFVRSITQDQYYAFADTWILFSLLTVLGTVLFCFRKISKFAILFWLTPAALYFTAFRFDIYPSVFCLSGLYFLSKNHLKKGAFLLGITIAFKGYFLFAVPSLFIWFFKKDRKNIVTLGTLTLAPFVISSLIVLIYTGLDGFLMPFLFHLNRGTNGESLFDLLPFNLSFISKFAQIFFALLPVPFIYKNYNFEKLIDALLISVMGFITFSTFYSPQFCLWIIPFLCFKQTNFKTIVSMIFLMGTFFYFPVTYLEKGRPEMKAVYDLTLIVVTLCRLVLISEALFSLTKTFHFLWQK